MSLTGDIPMSPATHPIHPHATDNTGAPEQPSAETEYATEYSGGSMLVWNTAPHVLAVYPLAERIEHGTRHGGKVWRRRVIVVEDWTEVYP